MIEAHRAASGGPAGAVIIPAHNEERVIARTLDGLLPLLSSPEVDVIVVCNGCTDGTAEVARRYAGVTVLETPVGSKPAAMNLGDAATERWPRLYLDADIEVEASAVEAVFRELSRPGAPLASRPSSIVDTRGAMFPVRSYYRARARIPELPRPRAHPRAGHPPLGRRPVRGVGGGARTLRRLPRGRRRRLLVRWPLRRGREDDRRDRARPRDAPPPSGSRRSTASTTSAPPA